MNVCAQMVAMPCHVMSCHVMSELSQDYGASDTHTTHCLLCMCEDMAE